MLLFFLQCQIDFIGYVSNIYIPANLLPVYTIESIKREIKFYPPEYNTNTK